LPDDLVVTDGWVVPAAELSERFSRSSGPVLAGHDGEHAVDEPARQPVEDAGAHPVRHGARPGQVDRQLDPGVGRVDALAARAGRAREPLGQLGGGNDPVVGDFEVVGHPSTLGETAGGSGEADPAGVSSTRRSVGRAAGGLLRSRGTF